MGWNFKKLMSNFKSASSNLLKCYVSSKNKKVLNLGPEIPYLGIFGLQFNKNYYQIFNQHTRICETIKFHPKRKKKNLGPKMLYFGLWLECWKTIVIFLSFVQKLESLNLEPKNVLFKCFEQQLWKTIVIFGISTLEFDLLQSFVQKIKIFKFGTKNALLG